MSSRSAFIIVAAMILVTFGGLAVWITSQNKDVYHYHVTDNSTPAVEDSHNDGNNAHASVPKYRVISDTLDVDGPGRTQITLIVAIDELVTEQKLRNLFEHQYQKASQRGPFKYREHANYIWIQIYARNDQVMIANAHKIPSTEHLEVNIKKELLATINDPPVEKFGLSERQRQAIWREIILVERRANNEAESTYPWLLPSSDPNYTEEKMRENTILKYDLDDELRDKYALELAASRGLTTKQLDAIGDEGVDNWWKTPDIPIKSEPVEELKIAAGFRGVPWGSNEAAIQAHETSAFDSKLSDWLIYLGSVSGLQAAIGYRLIDNKLCQGRYSFMEKHTNDNDYIRDYNNLVAALTLKYGMPLAENIDWKNKLYFKDKSDWGLAVSMGHLTYNHQWLLPESILILAMVGDNYEIKTIIEYQSAACIENIKSADLLAASDGL